jgi:H(+)-translocating pyrophosphatase
VIGGIGIGGAVIALLSTVFFTQAVLKEEQGNSEMRRLRGLIYDGARAYLLTQYKWLTAWVAIVAVGIAVLLGPVSAPDTPLDGLYTAISFIIGSFFSGLAGYIGMAIATQANSRTAEACRTSISRGLEVSFASGAVMGNAVVGLGLLGLSIFYLVFTYTTTNGSIAIDTPDPITGCPDFTWDAFSRVFNRLAGFGFGASTIGMFARVGGGVFTKAADVGSDLVGKVEQGIPEDDPRNPAVIADNVGDNVGDVAGMGADLFESYAGAVIATATLSPRLAGDFLDTSLTYANQVTEFNSILTAGVALPFIINMFGVIASLVGIVLVRNYKLDDNTSLDTLLKVITNGVWLASGITTLFSAGAVAILFKQALAWRLFGTIVIGLVAGIIIAKFTEYCTAYEFRPTRGISEASEYGPAPVIIKGLGMGMLSVSVPAVCVGVTLLACNILAGQYGVAISAVGLLSTLGITLATDAYGPVADNAGGIAEMAGLESFVRSRTDKLDSLGNTTAATGKGLAIASATLTAVGLIAAFVEQSGLIHASGHPNGLSPEELLKVVDFSDSLVLTGVLFGAALPYIFGALTMLSVDRGARAIITEVRLQFATAPLLMKGQLTQTVDGHVYPDSTRCVEIATTAAIQEMILPGVLAVFVPVIIGFVLGPKGTAGLLGGALGGCFMLALTMATTGGAWDNAKKWCEKCAEDGQPIELDAVAKASGMKAVDNENALTFTHFGIKKARIFPDIYREHGIGALVKDPATIPQFNTPEGLARLQSQLVELYHKRHSAVVTGDTIGDPFKDTSGPALNVLIKTMTMMALMLAPSSKSFGEYAGFGATGCSIAAVMSVVIVAICYYLVSTFRWQNAKAEAASIAKKKAADAKINSGQLDELMESGNSGSVNDSVTSRLLG